MSMLEKFCDAKNTFEGKALAAFMAAVLAFSLVNLSSLADAAENGAPTDAPEAQVDNPSTEVADNPASEPAPAAESEATAPLETPLSPRRLRKARRLPPSPPLLQPTSPLPSPAWLWWAWNSSMRTWHTWGRPSRCLPIPSTYP